MSNFHRRIRPALREGSSWASIAAALGTLGTQIPPPFSYLAFVAAALAAIVGVLLKDKGA